MTPKTKDFIQVVGGVALLLIGVFGLINMVFLTDQARFGQSSNISVEILANIITPIAVGAVFIIRYVQGRRGRHV